MSILADTSIWVDHLRAGDEELSALLRQGAIRSHPFIVGELACGNLKNRNTVIELLEGLPEVTKVDDDEILAFIAARHVAGKGLGVVDIHLLAAAILDKIPIWTRDKRMHGAAASLKCAYQPG